MFRKIVVQITENSIVHVYTDITCTVDDRVVIETKGGLVRAQCSISGRRFSGRVNID